MAAILYRMDYAIPGDVDRSWVGMTIEPNYADPTNPVPAYGAPVKLNAAGTGVVPLGVGDLAAAVYGVLARPFPSQAARAAGDYGQQLLTDPQAPPTKGELDILRRGYIGVHVNSGSSAGIQKGAAVWIWIAATTTGHTQGGFEGVASGGSTIAAPATFMGPVDPKGNTQIAWNI